MDIINIRKDNKNRTRRDGPLINDFYYEQSNIANLIASSSTLLNEYLALPLFSSSAAASQLQFNQSLAQLFAR